MEKRNDCRENAQKYLFYSHSFSCNSAHFLLHRSRQLAVFLELWISVSSQIHGTLVSRTSYARSDGLHFFLLCHGSQCHSAAFCQSQSENIDAHNIWCNLVVQQPFSQSKIFFEEELQPTVFVETFKNERLYWISLITRAGCCSLLVCKHHSEIFVLLARLLDVTALTFTFQGWRSFTWINNCHLARNFRIPERTAFFKSRLPWYLPENSEK